MKTGKPVMVLESELKPAVWQELFRIGRERQWVMLDLRLSSNHLPRSLRPVGAFVNKLPNDPFVKRLLNAGCHVVRLGTAPNPKDHLVPAVLPDMAFSGELAAEHFAERGFRHLAFVGHRPWGMHEHLYKRFQMKAVELGCACHEYRWVKIRGIAQALKEQAKYRRRLKLFKDWLSAVPKPLGLLGYSDMRACLYSRMCIDAGFAVPDEIGILGIGNNENVCETVYPSMSSIISDDKRIVENAVSILDQLISGTKPEETTVLVPPAGLVARRSTNVFAAKTPGVAKAIRFMLDHYTETIGIEEIVRESGMSRARLFVAFDKDLGHPPGIILTRIRIDKAKQMLRETGEKVFTISEACGFGASTNMYHHFKIHLSMSPAAYRQSKQQTYVAEE